MSYIRFRLKGMDEALNLLKSLPPEIVSKKGGPVKLALRKGAIVLRDEEKRRLLVVIAARGKDYSTGLLYDNIIVSRGKAPTFGKGERVLVRIKKKVYPRPGDGKPTTTLKTAHIMEYGSEKQQATPFIRPSFHTKKNEVVTVVTTDLVARINRIVKKLGRR